MARWSGLRLAPGAVFAQISLVLLLLDCVFNLGGTIALNRRLHVPELFEHDSVLSIDTLHLLLPHAAGFLLCEHLVHDASSRSKASFHSSRSWP